MIIIFLHVLGVANCFAYQDALDKFYPNGFNVSIDSRVARGIEVDCETLCRSNEILRKCDFCSKRCDEEFSTCDYARPCRPACECYPGYRRNKYGICVAQRECYGTTPCKSPESDVIDFTCYYIHDVIPCNENTVPAGTIVYFACMSGLVSSVSLEDTKIICDNGTWTGSVPNCAKVILMSKKGIPVPDGIHEQLKVVIFDVVKYSDDALIELDIRRKRNDYDVNCDCVRDNEIYAECDACPQSCRVGPRSCNTPAPCHKGCKCKTGFLKNSQDKCVKWEDCFGTRSCNRLSSSTVEFFCRKKDNRTKISCNQPSFPPGTILTFQCKPYYFSTTDLSKINVICDDGAWSDSIPKCLRASCPINEEYSICSPCDKTCIDPHPKCGTECVPGCACKKGYVRNALWTCIDQENCPTHERCHGPNEIYVYEKLDGCDGTCADPYPYCNGLQTGCICESGHVRDSKNTCIHQSKCPKDTKCVGKNVVFQEKVRCDRWCEDPNIECGFYGSTGCICTDGFVRDQYKECVPLISCLPCQPIISVNMDFTCTRLGKSIPCDKLMPQGTEVVGKCKPYFKPHKTVNYTIVCNNRKWSDVTPYCVPATDDCNENEVYKSCGGCDSFCELPNKLCENGCETGCFCKEGFARNAERKCVLVENCFGECEENEIFTPCLEPCTDTCAKHIDCNPNTPCRPGCACIPGYSKNDDDECIPTRDCFGSRSCEIIDTRVLVSIDLECTLNDTIIPCNTTVKAGTVITPTCKTNYQSSVPLDYNIICNDGKFTEPIPHCFLVSCNENEYYSNCSCELSCNNIHNYTCDVQPCRIGCNCIHGYVRNRNRVCIPIDQCEPEECPIGQTYTDCALCIVRCDSPIKCNASTCQPSCMCGIVETRDFYNDCVLREECPTPDQIYHFVPNWRDPV